MQTIVKLLEGMQSNYWGGYVTPYPHRVSETLVKLDELEIGGAKFVFLPKIDVFCKIILLALLEWGSRSYNWIM